VARRALHHRRSQRPLHHATNASGYSLAALRGEPAGPQHAPGQHNATLCRAAYALLVGRFTNRDLAAIRVRQQAGC
jgi:hypothetical protein